MTWKIKVSRAAEFFLSDDARHRLYVACSQGFRGAMVCSLLLNWRFGEINMNS